MKNDHKCPFSATLMRNDYGCHHAHLITRRGGPDTGCDEESSSQRCGELFEHFKKTAVPALGYEDDLLSMPHSVLVKTQFGGLLGLSRLLNNTESTQISDIDTLIADAIDNWGDIPQIPCGKFVDAIVAFRPQRKRGR